MMVDGFLRFIYGLFWRNLMNSVARGAGMCVKRYIGVIFGATNSRGHDTE